MTLIICGLPSSGKTTVGKIVAQHLNWVHKDTDELILQNYPGKKFASCRDLYKFCGDEKFRRLEETAILSMNEIKKCIISIGGGTLSYFNNAYLLKSKGDLIHLKSDLNLLWRRLIQRGIPPYLDQKEPEKSFYALMRIREEQLIQLADVTIEINNYTPQEVAEAIIFYKQQNYGK